MIQLFHLKIQIKKTKVDCIVDPYPLGWVHHNTSLQATKQYKLKFTICKKYIDEVVFDVIHLDICGVILGNSYMWEKDGIYYRRLKKI